MNRFLPLLLILLLLTGCAAQDPVPPVAETVDIPAPSAAFMEPAEDDRSIPRYAVPEDVTGFLMLGDDLVFFSGFGATTLTLVDPHTRQVIGVHETGMVLTSQNAAVQILETGLSYFNGQAGQTVVLDRYLQESRRIAAPENLSGTPLLTQDGNTVYYCTSDSIRALDSATGISRILREASYPAQRLSGLLAADSVLQVSITEADGSCHTLFLSSETGRLLDDRNGSVLPETRANRFFLHRLEGTRHTILFGTVGEAPMVLNTWFTVDDSFFLGDRVLTAFTNQDHLELQLYSLDSGLRESCFLGIPSDTDLLNAAQDNQGYIWLLCAAGDGPLLYCWDPAETKTNDNTVYTAPRYTRQEPDLEQIAACNLYAQELSHRHGVEILVYTDAVAVEPWDYELEYEYDAPVLYQELERLDQRLRNYPPGFLQTLAEKFDAIKICIVRSIRGTPESGSVDIAGGIQFWDGYTAYIILAAGHDTERTLYHELCHLIDTVVLTESTAYDQWEKANPAGFQYANMYTHSMTAADWQQAGWESFLDDYSMSYPKEDRARVMEYAMTGGNAERFESPYLQAKLKLLCTGIREAFALEAWPEPLLWEQYLHTPIIPGT